LAFSGISVIKPELLTLLPEADHPYPIIDEYIRLSAEGHRISYYRHNAEHWLDVGKPETLEKAKQWNLS
jgi:NDP-sugar pyrophosphorylase family protein